MEMLMLAGAVIATLGGAFALAFRVVRPPLGQSAKPTARLAPAREMAPKVGAREPTQTLLAHLLDERKRHTRALRQALSLRRARNEREAFSKLLTERVSQAEAARTLGKFVQPVVGGRIRQWIGKTRLDLMVETVQREVEEMQMRFLGSATRPLTREGSWSRLITWARGGPATGAPAELEWFHRNQLAHVRFELKQARRIAREGRQAEALASLAAEYRTHLSNISALKATLRTLAGEPVGVGGASMGSRGDDEATEPSLTAILN